MEYMGFTVYCFYGFNGAAGKLCAVYIEDIKQFFIVVFNFIYVWKLLLAVVSFYQNQMIKLYDQMNLLTLTFNSESEISD